MWMCSRNTIAYQLIINSLRSPHVVNVAQFAVYNWESNCHVLLTFEKSKVNDILLYELSWLPALVRDVKLILCCGHVHITRQEIENRALFLSLGLPSTLIRLENGDLRKRSLNQEIWKHWLLTLQWPWFAPAPVLLKYNYTLNGRWLLRFQIST